MNSLHSKFDEFFFLENQLKFQTIDQGHNQLINGIFISLEKKYVYDVVS